MCGVSSKMSLEVLLFAILPRAPACSESNATGLSEEDTRVNESCMVFISLSTLRY